MLLWVVPVPAPTSSCTYQQGRRGCTWRNLRSVLSRHVSRCIRADVIAKNKWMMNRGVHLKRYKPRFDPTVGDIVDWPTDDRDHYEMCNGPIAGPKAGCNVSTIVNSYFVGAMTRLSTLAGALGRDDESKRLKNLGEATAAAMRETMANATTHLFVDNGNGGHHSSWHSSVFPLWVGVTAPGAATDAAFSFLKERRMVGSVCVNCKLTRRSNPTWMQPPVKTLTRGIVQGTATHRFPRLSCL